MRGVRSAFGTCETGANVRNARKATAAYLLHFMAFIKFPSIPLIFSVLLFRAKWVAASRYPISLAI